jgi:hypothetical protein
MFHGGDVMPDSQPFDHMEIKKFIVTFDDSSSKFNGSHFQYAIDLLKKASHELERLEAENKYANEQKDSYVEQCKLYQEEISAEDAKLKQYDDAYKLELSQGKQHADALRSRIQELEALLAKAKDALVYNRSVCGGISRKDALKWLKAEYPDLWRED